MHVFSSESEYRKVSFRFKKTPFDSTFRIKFALNVTLFHPKVKVKVAIPPGVKNSCVIKFSKFYLFHKWIIIGMFCHKFNNLLFGFSRSIQGGHYTYYTKQ